MVASVLNLSSKLRCGSFRYQNSVELSNAPGFALMVQGILLIEKDLFGEDS
jgi:hypothetical protein